MSEKKTEKMSDLRILMFGVGFVVLTDEKSMEYNERNGILWIDVSRGFIIRNWGTNNGIGELAARGPTELTILDALLHHIHIPASVLYMVLDVAEKAKKPFSVMMAESEKKIL